MKHNDKTANASVGSKGLRFGLFALTLVSCALPACKAMNESPNNKHYWFPTLAPPTKLEREMRQYNYPEGGDPYVDANVGPRSFDTRPRGWTDQRSKTTEVTGEYPDVVYD